MKAKLQVLVIEDSPEDAALMAHELRRGDFEVTCERVETEQSLKQALARGPWDVVLCDYTLPRFSGQAALRLVREKEPDLPFIYVSGTIGEDVAVEAMKSGVNDYVMKSDLKRLPPAVKRELKEAEVRRNARQLEQDRERLVEELETALTEVRRLSGLLSICSNCKRIRDEDGTWQAVESYIQAHSEAQFSRSLCPECQARLDQFPGGEDQLGEGS